LLKQGDRARVIFKNELPGPSSIHRHGFEDQLGNDGMPGISQEPVKPGESYTYNFVIKREGTFSYHSHMSMQEMAGMLGAFIMHPKTPYQPHCDKDFVVKVQVYWVLPNSATANTMNMEYNWLLLNGKAGPLSTPLIVRQGDRGRGRGNPKAQRNAASEHDSALQQAGQAEKKPDDQSDQQSVTVPIQELQEPEALEFRTGSDLPVPELLGDVVNREPMTLEQFLALADKSNPTLAQAQDNVDCSRQQARLISLPPHPIVGYSGDHIRGGEYHGGEVCNCRYGIAIKATSGLQRGCSTAPTETRNAQSSGLATRQSLLPSSI
jgi:hypothetical protein